MKILKEQLKKFDKKFLDARMPLYNDDNLTGNSIRVDLKQFLTNFYHKIRKAERRKTIETIELLEYTLYPYQVKRSKEWLAGYNYCNKGITEDVKRIIKELKC